MALSNQIEKIWQESDRFNKILLSGAVPTFIIRALFDWPSSPDRSGIADFFIACITSYLWPIYWAMKGWAALL